ncbi:claudin-16-like [Gastrophryne carolinensis]
MGSVSVELLSLFLGILSIGFLLVCSVTDCWRQDAKDHLSSIGLSSRCRGLWSECLHDHMANIWTCDIPLSYLNDHPVPLVVTRALIIVNGFLSIAAIPLLVLGMKCMIAISKEDDLKRKISRAAGIILLLGGLSEPVLASCLFVHNFNMNYITYGKALYSKQFKVVLDIPGVTYELGYSYWLAVASVGCVCTSASLLIFLNCRPDASAESKTSSGDRHKTRNGAMTYL